MGEHVPKDVAAIIHQALTLRRNQRNFTANAMRRALRETETPRHAKPHNSDLSKTNKGRNVSMPSREEAVLTAQLLLTYAQEGTLVFREAARRFVADVGAEHARELAPAFEAGWRLLRKKGFAVDEADRLANLLEGKQRD